MDPASKIIRPRKGAPAAAEKAEVPEESRGEDSHHQSRRGWAGRCGWPGRLEDTQTNIRKK